MIELSHIYKTYSGPVHALRNVSFKIDKGEMVFITGPSGAGKTTLFRLMSAYDTPTSGSASVLNTDIVQLKRGKLPYFRRQIGVVFQDFRLLKNRTIGENVGLPLFIRNERKSMIQRRVEEVLQLVGLKYKQDLFPDQLSGGEQQRVAIARAIIHRPGLLIADEPTGNLDPDLSREIMSLFDNVNAQGTTIFVATHDHSLIKPGSRVIQLRDGQVEGQS